MNSSCNNPGDPGCPNEAYICRECHERLMAQDQREAERLKDKIQQALDAYAAYKRTNYEADRMAVNPVFYMDAMRDALTRAKGVELALCEWCECHNYHEQPCYCCRDD